MVTASVPQSEADALVPLKPYVASRGFPYSTAMGWAKIGVDGVRLRIFRQGGRLFTKRSWMDEFFGELNRDI